LDLSFSRLVPETELLLPADLAVLMVGVAARQAASTTALAQAGFAQAAYGANGGDTPLFAPLHGAFNGPMARLLMQWKRE